MLNNSIIPTNWRLLIIYHVQSGIEAISYLGKLSRGHGNIVVNLKTARNSQGPIFILKFSFFLINMRYKVNILHNVILIDICIHLLAHSFVRSFKPFNHLSVHPSFPHSIHSSFLLSSNPPPILLINLLLTDQQTLAVSYVAYQLTGYFLLSLGYLINTLIPHPSSYIVVEAKAS